MRMPEKGLPKDRIFAELEAKREHDPRKDEARTFGLTFYVDPELTHVVEEANRRFLFDNGLDPTVYRSFLNLEREIVAMSAAHLGGDHDVVGNATSGGTESILIAVKAARDRARKARGIAEPQMLVPVSAHAAFFKAAQYFDIELITIPCDPVTLTPSLDDYRSRLTDRTALIVGSAPSYAHGVMDPIADLSALAVEHDLWLHVDGCIGGFLLPFLRDLGAPVPAFDFSLPGVTSISMDFHKYGFSAKGSSVVLYRNADARRYAIFACSEWTGYTVINPVVQSTRSGGPLAATWAALHHLGREGYLAVAKELLDTAKRLHEGIDAVPGLKIMGKPVMSLLAFTSTDSAVGIYRLGDALAARHWHVQPQFGSDGTPPSLHLTIMPKNAANVDEFLADLRAAVEDVRKGPAENPLLGMVPMLTPEAVASGAVNIEEMVAGMAGGGDVPDELAPLNELLERLDSSVRNRILTAFFNGLVGIQT